MSDLANLPVHTSSPIDGNTDNNVALEQTDSLPLATDLVEAADTPTAAVIEPIAMPILVQTGSTALMPGSVANTADPEPRLETVADDDSATDWHTVPTQPVQAPKRMPNGTICPIQKNHKGQWRLQIPGWISSVRLDCPKGRLDHIVYDHQHEGLQGREGAIRTQLPAEFSAADTDTAVEQWVNQALDSASDPTKRSVILRDSEGTLHLYHVNTNWNGPSVAKLILCPTPFTGNYVVITGHPMRMNLFEQEMNRYELTTSWNPDTPAAAQAIIPPGNQEISSPSTSIADNISQGMFAALSEHYETATDNTGKPLTTDHLQALPSGGKSNNSLNEHHQPKRLVKENDTDSATLNKASKTKKNSAKKSKNIKKTPLQRFQAQLTSLENKFSGIREQLREIKQTQPLINLFENSIERQGSSGELTLPCAEFALGIIAARKHNPSYNLSNSRSQLNSLERELKSIVIPKKVLESQTKDPESFASIQSSLDAMYDDLYVLRQQSWSLSVPLRILEAISDIQNLELYERLLGVNGHERGTLSAKNTRLCVIEEYGLTAAQKRADSGSKGYEVFIETRLLESKLDSLCRELEKLNGDEMNEDDKELTRWMLAALGDQANRIGTINSAFANEFGPTGHITVPNVAIKEAMERDSTFVISFSYEGNSSGENEI